MATLRAVPGVFQYTRHALELVCATSRPLTLAHALTRFLRAVAREHPRTAQGTPLVSAMLGAAGDILSQRKFRECGTNRPRARAHVMAMYGFLGLFVTTTLVAVFYYLNLFGLDVAVGPYGFFHPIKMLGNASGTLVLLGCILVVARRMTRPDAGRATDFDWVFVWVLFLTVLTGFQPTLLALAPEPGSGSGRQLDDICARVVHFCDCSASSNAPVSSDVVKSALSRRA